MPQIELEQFIDRTMANLTPDAQIVAQSAADLRNALKDKRVRPGMLDLPWEAPGSWNDPDVESPQWQTGMLEWPPEIDTDGNRTTSVGDVKILGLRDTNEEHSSPFGFRTVPVTELLDDSVASEILRIRGDWTPLPEVTASSYGHALLMLRWTDNSYWFGALGPDSGYQNFARIHQRTGVIDTSTELQDIGEKAWGSRRMNGKYSTLTGDERYRPAPEVLTQAIADFESTITSQ